MKILVAVKTCAKYRHRADAQRQTWAADRFGLDVRWFLGLPSKVERPDEVVLRANDDYLSLPDKVKAICAYAHGAGYDWVHMADDDTYIQLGRLLEAVPEGRDYVGRLRGPSGGFPSPYCSGFSYWLSRRAMAAVAGIQDSKDTADDRMVGNQLAKTGIKAELDKRYVVAQTTPLPPGSKGDRNEDRMVGNTVYAAGLEVKADYRYVVAKSQRNATSGSEGPRKGNKIISACEYEPKDMVRVHEEWLRSETAVPKHEPVAGKLDCVSVLMKTFLRDGMLSKSLGTLERAMPDARIVVVDDGHESREKIVLYNRLRQRGHAALHMPFDSGFGAKANFAIEELCKRKYALIGCDDFDFSHTSVRAGVERMVDVLDSDQKIGFAAGRVRNQPYEGFLERNGTLVKERLLDKDKDYCKTTPSGVRYWPCDLTVNYGLVRTSMFEQNGLHWHPEFKIGADHYLFFADMMKTGRRAALVDGASVNLITPCSQWQHPSYQGYRARAIKSLPAMFKYLGITEYEAFGGAREVLDQEKMEFRFYAGQGLRNRFTFTKEDQAVRCSHCERKKQ